MAEYFRKFTLLTVLVGILTSCADKRQDNAACRDPDEAVRDQTVVEATSTDLATNRAVAGSYLVAFRRQGGGPGLGFKTFTSEAAAHGSYLINEFGGDPRLANIRFLTSLDLSQPGGADTSDLDASPLMRLFWSQGGGHEPLVTTLAQVDFQSAEDATSALADWERQGLLWYAEPNYISQLSQEPVTNLFQTYSTDYTDLNYWWLRKINLTDAYTSIANRDLSVAGTPSDTDLTTNRPIIAILDSGVDYEHPALKDRMWTNTDQNAAGCKNDLHGCDTTLGTTKSLGGGDVYPFDTSGPGQSCEGRDNNCSHGTHVAGIIAADQKWTDRDGRPSAGICPVCQIMALKIVSRVGKDSGILDSSIVAAFKYVSRFQHEKKSAVRVINASFGKFVRSRSVGLLVRLLKERNGTIVIAAAGNEDTLSMEYPAAFNDAIAVSAVDENLRKVSFSNFGRWVDISAPGSFILSTVPGAGLEPKSGTSMAAPMVTGVAGLMLARFPDISFSEMRKALVDGADPSFYREDSNDGFNSDCYYVKIPQEDIRQPLLGSGVLNANSAINRTSSQNLPIFSNSKRVKPGCGVISRDDNAANRSAFWALVAPALLAMFYSLQLNRRMLRNRRSSPSRLA